MDKLLKLEYMAKDMDILFRATGSEMQYNVYFPGVIDGVNSLIDGLVELSDGLQAVLELYPDDSISARLDEIAAYFEDVISYYNSDDGDSIKTTFIGRLTPGFQLFHKDLSSYFFKISRLKKAVVLGVDHCSTDIEKLVDTDKCRLAAFFSSNPEQCGKNINGIPIFGVEELPFFQYDYLIKTQSVYHDDLASEEHSVIELSEYLTYYENKIHMIYSSYLSRKSPIDGFITGLSYAEVGIDPTYLNGDVLNAAVSSQDLYYDYLWAEMFVHDQRINSGIKYALIGMCYYSFEYELIKSRYKNRACFYYPVFRSFRDQSDQEKINKYKSFEQLASEIFVKDYPIHLYHLFRGLYQPAFDEMTSRFMDNEEIRQGKAQAERDCNKDYPDTVRNNTRILRKYLSLLKSKNIIPVIVVCPTSSHYSGHFSQRLKDEFYSIINSLKSEFDLFILDYFDCIEFFDRDFYDCSHLNQAGAQKFSKMLNKRLKEILTP
ncbi:MAG TPA: hypothetical protein DEB10_00680 [Ruminococcaceae bacterium]|nr:hypothetical protein [Oscillospiraceae bacterium]